MCTIIFNELVYNKYYEKGKSQMHRSKYSSYETYIGLYKAFPGTNAQR